jgi:hypothetical protein
MLGFYFKIMGESKLTLCIDKTVRSAIHAPTNKDWKRSINYPWGSSSTGGDPSKFSDLTIHAFDQIHSICRR